MIEKVFKNCLQNTFKNLNILKNQNIRASQLKIFKIQVFTIIHIKNLHTNIQQSKIFQFRRKIKSKIQILLKRKRFKLYIVG